MGQRKKIPDSIIIEIIKGIDEGTIKLRVKARELEIAPSSLHARIKKIKNRQSIHNNIFIIPDVKKTEQKDRTPKKIPNKRQGNKKPTFNRIKKSVNGRMDNSTIKDMNKLYLRTKHNYSPKELLNVIHYVYTGKVTRLDRTSLVKKLIELITDENEPNMNLPTEFYNFIYFALVGKQTGYDLITTKRKIVSALKIQIKISIKRT